MRQTRDAVLDVALGDWPVDSGESKASIEPVNELEPVRVGIVATARHVPYIKDDPWTNLVVVPFERRMLAVGDELAADVEALFARGGR